MPVIAVCASLAGCISDPVQPFQVRPETVVAPTNAFFSAPISGYIPLSSPPKGSMLVKWNRSIADTQLNFKGYFVTLQMADTNGYYLTKSDSLGAIVDTITIFRPSGLPVRLTDTFYTFASLIGAAPNSGIPEGTYALTVYSEKTGTKDTTIISVDSSVYIGLFDPLPMQNPTNLRATSTGPTMMLLRWTDPVTDKDTGFLQYVVFYRDTTLSTLANDSGHLLITVPKGGNDSTIQVGVPPASGTFVTSQEYPYQFWVKSERRDSTFFYNLPLFGPDTNHIVWAGAEMVPKTSNDTSVWNAGYLLVPNLKTMYFGSLNQQYDLAVDSTDNTGQVIVTVGADSIVTLTVQSPNGAGFLTRMDVDSSLDSVFYTAPLADPTQFSNAPIALPKYTTNRGVNGGVIVYLMMNGDQPPVGQHQWARILIHAQQGGTFVNPNNGGIDVKGSFQPGLDQSGQVHLPFY